MNICLIDYESTTAAGINISALCHSLSERISGLRENDFDDSFLSTWIGRVADIDSCDDLGTWQSRNNALAAIALEQGHIKDTLSELSRRFSPARLGIVVGSSTSSIDRTEQAYKKLDQGALGKAFQQPLVHNPGAPALFIAHYTGISGPAITINTACSSSAKVFATGARWLASGIVDAVLVGGVDTLCLNVLHGFDALQLVSSEPCKPFDQARDGINLGEAAGFAIMQREEDSEVEQQIYFRGYGESSDAYHMSHPHPQGFGARLAIEQALSMADLLAEQIDYINLHGTASHANDLIEGQLIAKLFPKSTLCSSTKGWVGHTLGAAGITESLIALETLRTGLLPGTLNLEVVDERLDFSILRENRQQSVTHVMSNSFGFGGNNCSLIFSRTSGREGMG